MWLSRSKSSRNNNKNDVPMCRTPSNPDFNTQSFKDVENLFAGDVKFVNNANDCSDLSNSQEQPCSSSSAVSTKRLFQRVHLSNKLPPEKPESQNAAASVGKPEPPLTPVAVPGSEKRVVVYMTSLRVVRPTFEACRTVQSIFLGFRVPVDQRDLSMDSAFVDELQRIMGQVHGGGTDAEMGLPRVFIGGRYIGGAEEVVMLHETGELKKFVEGLPTVTPGVCKICGGFRFILCDECNGSHKCHTENGGFKRCTSCNENGLLRCPSCSSS